MIPPSRRAERTAATPTVAGKGNLPFTGAAIIGCEPSPQSAPSSAPRTAPCPEWSICVDTLVQKLDGLAACERGVLPAAEAHDRRISDRAPLAGPTTVAWQPQGVRLQSVITTGCSSS